MEWLILPLLLLLAWMPLTILGGWLAILYLWCERRLTLS